MPVEIYQVILMFHILVPFSFKSRSYMCSGNGYEAGDMHILTTYITSINHMHRLTPDFMSPLTWHFLPFKVL